jgi:hypothetical protein
MKSVRGGSAKADTGDQHPYNLEADTHIALPLFEIAHQASHVAPWFET